MDENFPKAVLSWVQNGQELAELEDPTFISATIPAPISNTGSPITKQGLDKDLETSAQNGEFTPNPKDPGGHPQKQSPIRPKRTYRAVLVSPSAPHPHGTQDMPTSPILFRHYGKRPGRPTLTTPSSPTRDNKPTVSLEEKLCQASSKSIKKPVKAA